MHDGTRDAERLRRITHGQVAGLLDSGRCQKGRRTPHEKSFMKVVSRIFASWNQLDGWFRQIDSLRRVA